MNAAASIAYPACLCESEAPARLIVDARAGSAIAFERLVVLHEALVLRFAGRILLNREAARDAAQEVFFRLFRSLRSIDEARDLRPWLYRTTSNICLDLLRRARQTLSIDLVAEPELPGRDPEQALVSAQQHRALLEALGALSPRERQAIVLRDLEGHSTAEVARLLGSTETTVRSQISTGRVKLRSYLLERSRQ